MKKNSLLLALLIMLPSFLFAQKIQKLDKTSDRYDQLLQDKITMEPIVCPANHSDVNTYVDFAEDVKQALDAKKRSRGITKGKQAIFAVEYIGFPDNARASFQLAVDIWSQLLESNDTIHVVAIWQALGRNVLGSASPFRFRSNFPGAPKRNVSYPISLAEKISRRELNSPLDFDIIARFSSDQNWYLGSTGNPAVGQFDLTSVVLHELCHGLGFFSSLGVNGSQGGYGVNGLPAIMDLFIKNDKGQSLMDTARFKNPSTELRNELIGENLFFVGKNTTKGFSNRNPRLYAPTVFDAGSSISHLDSKDFPAGSPNSLMTPSAGFREVSRDPGPIVKNIFKDIGYRSSAIVHEPLKDFETATSIDFVANVFSDTTFNENKVELFYLELNLETATVADIIFTNAKVAKMAKTTGTEYKAKIPVANAASVFFYWMKMVDNFGDTLVAPGGAPAPGTFYQFFVGLPDETGPAMFYFPPNIVNTFNPVAFEVFVEDDYQAPIDTVFVRYSIDGGPQQTTGLRKYDINRDGAEYSRGVTNDDIMYFSDAGIPQLSSNQRVRYQVIARDGSGNETIIPTTANGPLLADLPVVTEYEIAATELEDPVETYLSNFNDPTTDFTLLGFDVVKPEGLDNNALKTTTPYPNGKGLYDPTTVGIDGVNPRTLLAFENESIAFLRKPIIIKADSSTISFDEIVLVEPGEDGSVFGDDDFWDYVVVEVSLDFGSSWDALVDGYDSGVQDNWKTLFNNNLTPAGAQNTTSTGVPSAALYRSREINLYDTFTAAAAGNEMLVRFRLFSDQWVNGYGWVIDNLAIQTPKPKPLSNAEELSQQLKIGPNPTTDFIDIKIDQVKGNQVNLNVFDIKGQVAMGEKVNLIEQKLNHRLQVGHLTAGTYILKVVTEEGTKIGKFVVN